MNLSKAVYEIREALNAISDDRRIDDRYIIHMIDTARQGLIRQLLARRVCLTTLGMQQHYPMELKTVSRSLCPSIEMPCKILRSVDKVPKLIYEGASYKWFTVRTADVQKDTVETIDWSRVPHITFEFNTPYSFLAPGLSEESTPEEDSVELSNYYLYVISKDNFNLKCAIVSGIFESPLEVDPDLEDYPLNGSEWLQIKPTVMQMIASKPAEDPLNNSEPDDGKRMQAARGVQGQAGTSEVEES